MVQVPLPENTEEERSFSGPGKPTVSRGGHGRNLPVTNANSASGWAKMPPENEVRSIPIVVACGAVTSNSLALVEVLATESWSGSVGSS